MTVSGPPRNRVGTHLLEREGEIDALTAALDSAAEGRGALVVIEAAAGLGKTALLRAALELGEERDLRPLAARGSELESEFPFGLVRQLLEPVVHAGNGGVEEDLFAGAAELARPLLGPAVPFEAEGPDRAFSALHGLYWLVHNLAERSPLVLCVDDLQWADAPSLRFLAFLLSRLEELPVAVVAASRPDERNEDPMLARVMASPLATELRPRPLSPRATASFIEAELDAVPDDAFVSACHGAVAGNPFYLRELARELAHWAVQPHARHAARVRELGPRSVSRSVLLRLSALPVGATEVVRALAVLGDGAAVEHVAALAGVEEGEAAAVADTLARVRILRHGGRLEFLHPIVREAVYADLEPQERAQGHARAAALLAEAGAPAERVAAQLLEAPAGSAAGVAAMLAEAAREAITRGSPEVAARYLRRALDELGGRGQRAGLLALLGASEARMRDPRAPDHLQEALELTTDPAERAELAIELGRALLMAGRLQEAIATLERAIASPEPRDAELGLRLEAELIGAARLDISRREDAARRLERVASGITDYTPAGRPVLANVAFEQVARGENPARAAQLAERALAGGALLAEQSPDSPVYYLAAWTLALTDRLGQADAALALALRDARVRGSALAFTIASCFRSNVAYRMGSVTDAEVNARAVLDVDPEERWPLGLPFAVGFLLDALVEQGALDAGQAVLDETGFADGDLPDFTLFIYTLWGRGRLRVARGEIERGGEDLLRAGERGLRWGSRNPTFLPWRSEAALALHACGEERRARELVEDELTRARAAGAGRALGIALRAAGVLGLRGDSDAALQESVRVLERVGARLEQARALTDLGALLRRANRRSEARTPLTRGLELAGACGATVLADRARTELAAMGARPRNVMLSGLESLTPSERRVGGLAARGMSNAQIAQSLFVTLKTVETHLSAVYRKLDIASRHELPRVLAGEGAEA